MSKKTLILGASPNPERHSNKALIRLKRYGHEVVAIGAKTQIVEGIEIQVGQPWADDIHTIAMYINPSLQANYYDYIISLKPKRIIFNPGTENYELIKLGRVNDIEIVEGCVLVMLCTNNY
ncbi:MAG: CoA-binding protein [Bacteroidetes bacterium GWA2_30_7]|nr:MAG: CoA-binding protein [Bacteroidetes bacterium GWA2_30_7]